jgi:hypothetical protein
VTTFRPGAKREKPDRELKGDRESWGFFFKGSTRNNPASPFHRRQTETYPFGSGGIVSPVRQLNSVKWGLRLFGCPPFLKTTSGAGPDADGYGPFDDYYIGSRDQKGPRGTTFTRFGTRE